MRQHSRPNPCLGRPVTRAGGRGVGWLGDRVFDQVDAAFVQDAQDVGVPLGGDRLEVSVISRWKCLPTLYFPSTFPTLTRDPRGPRGHAATSALRA